MKRTLSELRCLAQAPVAALLDQFASLDSSGVESTNHRKNAKARVQNNVTTSAKDRLKHTQEQATGFAELLKQGSPEVTQPVLAFITNSIENNIPVCPQQAV
jgi:hypothetical protein